MMNFHIASLCRLNRKFTKCPRNVIIKGGCVARSDNCSTSKNSVDDFVVAKIYGVFDSSTWVNFCLCFAVLIVTGHYMRKHEEMLDSRN